MKETYLKTIWSMMDSLKGVMTPEQELDLISVIAFVKSQDEEAFARLLNVGKSSLVREFKELISQLSKTHINCLDAVHFEIDPEGLSKLLIKMSEHSTLEGFTEAYRDAVQKTLGMRGGDNVSNSNEAHLIQALLSDVKDKSIYDGTAGMASTTSLLGAKHLWLQDINRSTAQAGSRLLKMEGQSFSYSTGNSLEQPSFKAGSCDLAVMTPPLGMRLSSLERIQDQPYLLPDISAKLPTSGSDSLWLQLALYSLNKTGKAFITLAPGWLFRGGYDAKVREYLIEHELIESIVMLPQGYFSHTQIQGALIILQKDKPKGTPIRLIDARNMGRQSKKELILESKDISLVADLYAGKIKDEAVCKDIPLSEIRAKDYSLSFSGYFVQEIEEIEINPEKELQKLADLTHKHQQSQQKLMQLLNESKG